MGRSPFHSTFRLYCITQWPCSAPGSLWEMPDSNPGCLSQKSAALRISHHDSKCRLFVRVCMKCFVLLMAGTESPPLERSETQGAALEKELYRYSLSALGSVRKFNSWRLWLSSILYVTKFSTIFLMYRYLFLRTLLNNHTDSLFTVHQ